MQGPFYPPYPTTTYDSLPAGAPLPPATHFSIDVECVATGVDHNARSVAQFSLVVSQLTSWHFHSTHKQSACLPRVYAGSIRECPLEYVGLHTISDKQQCTRCPNPLICHLVQICETRPASRVLLDTLDRV